MEVNRAARVAISWADAEGWNPGLDDAERFLAADPDSFLATELHREIVATVSCALYGESYAFIGFYIVAIRPARPRHREPVVRAGARTGRRPGRRAGRGAGPAGLVRAPWL